MIAVIIFEAVIFVANALIPTGANGCGCFKHEAFSQPGSMKVTTTDSRKAQELKKINEVSEKNDKATKFESVSRVEEGADNKV
jgi:hypothetical protein